MPVKETAERMLNLGGPKREKYEGKTPCIGEAQKIYKAGALKQENEKLCKEENHTIVT